MTSWSLNCSRMSSQMGVGGSSGSAVPARQSCPPHRLLEPSHTILAVLLAQALDLLLRETFFFCYLEMLERLCRRLGVCILHAFPRDPPPSYWSPYSGSSIRCRLACVFCNARVQVRRKDIEIASNMYRRLPWSPCNGTRSLERQMQTTVYRDFETFESPQATRLVKIGSSAQFSASSACW